MEFRDSQERWLLPDGLDEVLPPDGERYEELRRTLLDLFSSWGYELVVPPLVEYLESLLIGVGADLDLQTFKLTDLESGRTLGVRADMTPQVARIDAHQLRRPTPTRLCYVGTVLRTRPEGPADSRSPVQVGAELYGHAGLESDAEVVTVMLELLEAAGVPDIHLDLGNAAIFRTLADGAGLDADTREAVFVALQRKAGDEVIALLDNCPEADPAYLEMLRALPGLNGSLSVLDDARQILHRGGSAISAAIDKLSRLADVIGRRQTAPTIHVDLAELRGYRYHPGIVFSAFTPGYGQEIARGGRYDDIGGAFGRARPATGFSADLRTLLRVGERPFVPPESIFAPASLDPTHHEFVMGLRQQGKRVVQGLGSADANARAHGCQSVVAGSAGVWRVDQLGPETTSDIETA
jgi:ATP phosphoribosyltransferase regulatory subunit